MRSPVLSVARRRAPASTPTLARTGAGASLMAPSTLNDTQYRPAASRETVAIFGICSGSVYPRSFTAPSWGSTRWRPGRSFVPAVQARTFPACRASMRTRTLCGPLRDLNRGYRARPAKKFPKAVSRSRSFCVTQSDGTSASHPSDGVCLSRVIRRERSTDVSVSPLRA